MIKFTHSVKDPNGIHARPAGLFTKEASRFSSQVMVTSGEKSASGKKLIALLAMSVKCGDTLTVTVEGDDEAVAAEALKAYLSAHV